MGGRVGRVPKTPREDKQMIKLKLAASEFAELDEADKACRDCGAAERVGFLFDYAYQPIVDVAARTVYGHEALVRGPHGEGAQSVLSQVNEKNRYRFDQACRVKAIKTAAQLGIQERISINFLPNAIYKPEVCIRTTLEAARAHGFPLERIIFEVTEGERVEDGPWLAEILREYKRCGLLTAIDDFGAGYAGLTLLAGFQPDLIKIDMELVRNVDLSRSRQAIVRGLVRVCDDLGVKIIAEGIETAGERDFLADAGIRLMQGDLFSRPVFQGVGRIEPHAWGDTAAARAVAARA
jgi:EAL domain-containing protein (putative c-di-GMP-specific phosphodiesterase class I)